MFNPLFGPVNVVLGWLGLETPGWVADEDTARYPFVVMSLFQIGEGFLVLLAGMRSAPRELYDAAAVDGAGRLRSFRSITLPLLVPWLLLLTFRDIIVVIQYPFAPTFLMTGGGPVLLDAVPALAHLRGGVRPVPFRVGIAADAGDLPGDPRPRRDPVRAVPLAGIRR